MKTFSLKILSAGVAFALSIPVISSAQTNGAFGYYEDALRLSQNELMGTARMQGIGGAKAALGGDLSVAAVNPAGLGFLNKTTISFSPGIYIQRSQAGYLGNQTSDFAAPVGIASYGISFHSNMEGNEGDWRGGNFAISHTRLSTYNEKVTYEGSLRGVKEFNDFVGYSLNELTKFGLKGASELAFSAYNTFLVLGPKDGYDEFTSFAYAPNEDLPTLQAEVIEMIGKKNSFNLSYGANYKDKLYIGAGIGFLSYQRELTRAFEERPTPQDTMPLVKVIIDEAIKQSGSGFNANFGLIYRPFNFLMIGASVETPSLFALEESFEQFVTSTYTSNYVIDEAAGKSKESGAASKDPFQFTVLTPMRARGGATVFLGKLGFITADVEFVDYGSASLSAVGTSLSGDNAAIESNYKSVFNYSVGGEFRHEQFYGRLGYSFQDDPLKKPVPGVNREVHYFSAGAGFRRKHFFLDLAVVGGRTQSEWNRYEGGAFATVQNNETRMVLTGGVRF